MPNVIAWVASIRHYSQPISKNSQNLMCKQNDSVLFLGMAVNCNKRSNLQMTERCGC